MNKKITIVLGLVLFAAFGFIMKKNEVKKTVEVSKNIPSEITCFFNQTKEVNTVKKLNFFVKTVRDKTVPQYQLKKSKSLKDFIEFFPSSWISEYISVEITKETQEGKILKATGKNSYLTNKQKEILGSSKIGDLIRVKIAYRRKNPVVNKEDISESNFTMLVFPDEKASFMNDKDGEERAFEKFLLVNSSEELLNWKFEPMQSAVAKFFVNKKGEISDVKITSSTGVISLDESIITLLKKIPKWKPAKTKQGQFVKQEFELTIGDIGC